MFDRLVIRTRIYVYLAFRQVHMIYIVYIYMCVCVCVYVSVSMWLICPCGPYQSDHSSWYNLHRETAWQDKWHIFYHSLYYHDTMAWAYIFVVYPIPNTTQDMFPRMSTNMTTKWYSFLCYYLTICRRNNLNSIMSPRMWSALCYYLNSHLLTHMSRERNFIGTVSLLPRRLPHNGLVEVNSSYIWITTPWTVEERWR